MDNISIISIPDSDTSACGALNETYSPKKRPSVSKLAAVTPKREADTTLNSTFTPEDKKTASNVQNETFSPVKEEEPQPEEAKVMVEEKQPEPVASKRFSRTPRKMLPEIISISSSFDSPAPNPVPEINVVPPSTDRRAVRRSVRTPMKSTEPIATRASTRRSVRVQLQQQTPLKTVPEKKRGRKSKKDMQAEEEEAAAAAVAASEEAAKQQQADEKEETVPMDQTEQKNEIEKTEIGVEKEDPIEITDSPSKKLKLDDEETKEEEEAEIPEKKIKIEQNQSLSEATKDEDEKQKSLTVDESRSLLFETEQPTLVEVTAVASSPEGEADDDDEDFLEDDAMEAEITQSNFHAPMFAVDVLPKSIRKRSMSVTDMHPPVAKRNFRVQFHSPGNMEKTITEIDESLYLNYTKAFASSFSIPSTSTTASENAAKNKPIRRKRSLSNAETHVDKLATLQFLSDKNAAIKEKEKPTATGSATKKVPTPSPRKKMPNFAAIHQSIFQQMESLVDFKERTKERAQFLLTTPTAGAPVATITARPNILKPVGRGAIGKANAGVLKKQASNLMKPKHRAIGRKATTTVGLKLTEKKLEAILQTTEFPALADEKETTTMTTVADKIDSVPAAATEPKEKPEEIKENVTASKTSKIKVPRVYNKDTAIKPRPLNVSLSTTSMTGLRNRSIAVPSKTTTTRAAPAKTATLPQFPVKPVVAAAQAADAGAKPVSAYKIVKGVRMNRRFELMMKHRNKATAAADKN